MENNSIAALILDAIRPELSKLIEDAVLSALSKTQQLRRYPERVGVGQAAEITGYSKNSLYQMHSHGKIPCAIKVGSKLMFRTRELQEWVENGGANCRAANNNGSEPALKGHNHNKK